MYLMTASFTEISFRLSEKHLLFNFLNVLEIMLNEIRKKDVSLGLFDYS